MQKLVVDKNKFILAVNKNKKKANVNVEETPELVPPPNRSVSNPAAPGEENRVLNRCIELLDFSNCSFDPVAMSAFLAAAVECSKSAVEMPEGATPLVLRVRGVGGGGDSAGTLENETFSGQISVQT
jgi:hypothetical protein